MAPCTIGLAPRPVSSLKKTSPCSNARAAIRIGSRQPLPYYVAGNRRPSGPDNGAVPGPALPDCPHPYDLYIHMAAVYSSERSFPRIWPPRTWHNTCSTVFRKSHGCVTGRTPIGARRNRPLMLCAAHTIRKRSGSLRCGVSSSARGANERPTAAPQPAWRGAIFRTSRLRSSVHVSKTFMCTQADNLRELRDGVKPSRDSEGARRGDQSNRLATPPSGRTFAHVTAPCVSRVIIREKHHVSAH
jgi:hypothetical protein